ncbi:MFS transporter protein [Rutstroemia sp. NJR-2017a BBW]|nr:MFS transporter protein [Rutstroemia sp. NJR-2017a BBW]
MEKTLSEPKTDFGVKDVEAVDAGAQPTSIRRGEVGHDILTLQNVDPALDAKMHLVNNPSDADQWFRYAVDSMLTLLQSIIASQAALEFNASYSRALTIAVYVGLLLGALLWGLTADMIGRKIAFNTSLFICSGACIVAGAAPSWESLAFFIALVGFGGGGNLILDTTVFLEYLPSNKQWVLSNECPNPCEKKY